MPTTLQPADLSAMFKGQKRNLAWYDAVSIYHQLRVHADGELPIWLIKEARPNESEAVQQYRQRIYEPETQNPLERVIGVLEKIRRSPDWMIRFNEDVAATIPQGETLKDYLTENYPVYDSIENWLFEEALRNVALDANAVCVVMPRNLHVADTEFVEPVAAIYNAPKIIEFVPDDYCVLKSDEYSSLLPPDLQQSRQTQIMAATEYTPNTGVQPDFRSGYRKLYNLPYPLISQVYYVITTTDFQKWEETTDGKHQMTGQYIHNLGVLPAFQLPGKFFRRMGKSVIKKTPLFPMVPHLNKAARESNDLDAGVIMHLFPEKWEIDNSECRDCKGVGTTPSAQGPTVCKTCEGSGRGNSKSPFNVVRIKLASLGQPNVPVPPVGYVAKDSSIIDLQNTRVEKHIYRALEAVNMEHLSDTQLNQSGTAKAFDGDEVNNMIYQFAGNLVYVLETVIYFINELRYQYLLADEQKREMNLPVIAVPEKFDVVTTAYLIEQYQNAKNAGINSIMLRELQMDLSQKMFYANPDVAKHVQTIMELDPFPDKTIEEKSLLEAQQLATKEDVILSNYIADFVNQAKEDDPKFLDKTKTQKREILLGYAKKKNDLLNTAKQIQQDMFQQTPQQQQADQQMKTFNQDTRLMTGVMNAKV